MLSLAAPIVFAGAFAGGFVSGLAGFGTGLVALGIWLHVLPPGTTTMLVAVCSVLSQVQTISTVWHAIRPAHLWPMLMAGLFGVPLGAWLLTLTDPAAFRETMGVLLLAFSAFMLFGRVRVRIAWGGRGADAVVGFFGGVLGGLAGLSGPLPIVWATLRGWGKDERRGVFQAFNLTILGSALLYYAASGAMTPAFARLVMLAVPGTVLGSGLGVFAYRRLSDRRFHEMVLGLLGVSGATLIWSSL